MEAYVVAVSEVPLKDEESLVRLVESFSGTVNG